MIPQNYIKLEGAAANTMIRLMEAFEDHDDVQNVYSNADIDQKTWKKSRADRSCFRRAAHAGRPLLLRLRVDAELRA